MSGVNSQDSSIRLYDYIKVFGETNRTFDDYYQLPPLTVYNQFDSNLCVGYALATAAEIMWGKKFSAAWNYGKFRDESHKGTGLYLEKALKYFCEIGAVPVSDFPVFEDVPIILDLVNMQTELLNIAKNFRPSGYCNLKYAMANKQDSCIKDAISRYKDGVAVVATSSSFFMQNHCIAIVGWNDKTNSYIYQNSAGINFKNEKNGRGEIPKDKISTIYAIYVEPVGLPFVDISKNHWAYKDALNLYMSGIVRGTSENLLEPDKYITRAEMFATINRTLAKIEDQKERDAFLHYYKEELS